MASRQRIYRATALWFVDEPSRAWQHDSSCFDSFFFRMDIFNSLPEYREIQSCFYHSFDTFEKPQIHQVYFSFLGYTSSIDHFTALEQCFVQLGKSSPRR